MCGNLVEYGKSLLLQFFSCLYVGYCNYDVAFYQCLFLKSTSSRGGRAGGGGGGGGGGRGVRRRGGEGGCAS